MFMEKESVLKKVLKDCLELSKLFFNFSQILDKLLLVEAGLYVKKRLDWYLLHDFISSEAGRNLPDKINEHIKLLGSQSLEICQAFNIPNHIVYAPIYTGYTKYYSVDKTDGEHWDLVKPKF